MDSSSLRWFSRTEEGAYCSNKNKSIDDFTTQQSTISEDQDTTRELSLSPDSNRANSPPYFTKSKVSKIVFSIITPSESCPIQPKMSNNNSSSSPRFLSFNNTNKTSSHHVQGCKIEAVDEMYLCDSSDEKFFPNPNSKSCCYDQKDNTAGRKRIPSTSIDQHHIIAERKRREKLSQRFVELSAILPDLKKVDKSSILEQAINHVKELQEKVQLLEEKKKSTSQQESVMFVSKTQLKMEEDEYSSSSAGDLPADIEVRFSDNRVLIRITCARHNAFVLNILTEIEKLHLTIIQSCMMPFGKHATDVTVVAKMDESFCMTLKDLAKHLRMITGRLMTQA
ncbi:hypothetical protein CQW23_05205 [Capsicum baccatum]|uniref:BHLH domain-containing protein n=1 Tax=Capsicum baccatum TaxID=33114 RepID=A0A2G2XGY9_CAPBA|nr:hypothetical protein CQW23_05205 [Capsicum baccatum]